MKKIILITLFAAGCAAPHQPIPDRAASESAIRQTLADQVAAWNKGDIDAFMKGYWRSDSLLFVGRKIVAGWDSTLIRYKRSYPDQAAMGELRFDILHLDFTSANSCLVTGNYFLKREKDNPSGVFTLLFKKKNGVWVIVYDHTS
ncbi:MAG: nuclear transport factor 2 family protein [Bacteroidetes bacterium]|nr:nuclear transport factor 2 family protein [Bacteroidota bacterium]MBS1541658.1 nuclear transport factor 2 family protein [Bacteroidota bacterium]